jgi:hypothetical protein
MAQAGAPKHAMKMGVSAAMGIGRGTGRHEHGMDRKGRRDDGPAARSSHISNARGRSMKTLDHLASATLSVAILTATAFLPASAQSGPTMQEQMACRGDAGKFCAEHVGKPPQMNACLKANKAKLSEPCRKVVEARGG